MATQFKMRRDTAANWTSANPVLAQGEPGWETDTGLGKVGDGTTAWNSLKYTWPPSSPPQSVKTSDYTFALGDATAGKLVVANKAMAIAFTVPPQASVVWLTENVLRGFNKNDGLLTLTPGAGVTFIGSVLTFAKGTGFTAVRTASNEWVVLPFSSSSAPVVSGTTGSPTTSTVTLNGVTGTLYDYGANGSITCLRAGKARVVIIGGGSFDSGPNYGNVGGVFDGWIDLPASAVTITVGATGAAGSRGGGSSVGTIASAPGGDAASGSTTQRGGAGRGFVGAAATDGYSSNITGSAVAYGTEGSSTTYGSRSGPTPQAGRVFIFVPN